MPKKKEKPEEIKLIPCPACDESGTWTLKDGEKVQCRVCKGKKKVSPALVDPWSYNVSSELLDKPWELTHKQEMFCQIFATHLEYFGNGVKAYMEAYGTKNYQSASSNANRLLKNAYICLRINELMTDLVLNDTMADRELAYVMIQKRDLGSKNRAIEIYNKIKGRIQDTLKGRIDFEITPEDRERLDKIIGINKIGKK